MWYFAEGPHDTQTWRHRPATAVPAWAGQGRQPPRARLVKGAPAAQTVVAVAESLPAGQWSQQTIKEGSKGPLVAEFSSVCVIAVREGLPGPEV